MRNPPDIPKVELDQMIAQAVERYMHEVTHIRRALLRNVITDMCQAEGLPMPEGEAMETHVDVLVTLFEVGHDDPDIVQQLMNELEWSPEGKLSSEQILMCLANRFVETGPPKRKTYGAKTSKTTLL